MSAPGSRHASISPPPLKRRRVDKQTSFSKLPIPSTNVPKNPRIRVVAWNINGIAPFVQPYLQKTLDTFFRPSLKSASKRQRSPEHDGSDHDDDLSREGKASLREVLKRQGWPQVLLLQEIKIKPGDLKSLSAVRTAINNGLEDSSPLANRSKSRDSAEPNHSSIADATLRCLADGGPRYNAHFVLPSDPHNAKGFGGKVYGVAAIIREDVMRQVECVRDPSWDREGRVQIIETRDLAMRGSSEDSTERSLAPQIPAGTRSSDTSTGSKPQRLAIINVYAVNGTFNPCRSTHTGKVIGSRHDRKLAFHTELLKEALHLEARGFQVVIAGDLNIARERIDGYPNLRTSPHQHVLNRQDFNRKFFTGEKLPRDQPGTRQALYDRNHTYSVDEEPEARDTEVKLTGLDGIDTFRYIHGQDRRYSWHSRTQPFGTCCDRVDLILTSRGLEPYIVDAGICDSPRDRGPSDHCPIWVDIAVRLSSTDVPENDSAREK